MKNRYISLMFLGCFPFMQVAGAQSMMASGAVVSHSVPSVPTAGVQPGSSSAASFSRNSPLSLKLLSFTGRKITGGNELQWSTESEAGITNFDLERSANGSSYQKIASIQPDGSVGQTNYHFLDADLPAGPLYYRLRVTGDPKESFYSSVVALDGGAAAEHPARLLPNPVNGGLVYLNPGTNASEGTVWITDMQGRSGVKMPVSQLLQTTTGIAIPVQSLTAGLYLLRWIDGSGRVLTTSRFLRN